MEGGAMSAMYTQVDGTGNHIKVLDAQSTLVEWALAAISATVRSHPCNPCSLFTASLAHVSATTPRMGAPGASPPLAHPKKGSRQKLLRGADSTRSPATKSVCPGSTRFCAHAAQRFPLAAHQQGSSRHRSRSGGCLESNVDRRPSGPPSCAPCRKPRGLRATGSFVYGHFGPALQPAAACGVLALALARRKRIEGGRSRIHSSV
ncbi:hypothetical protein TGAM01_v208309 [Trichoderma gamsii]|uniref:Uncharacterized protein n=1 Tax=Trichoderma gamsii TaxID=398673 RepID=A0A2P4ZEY1_9HYPO|nr:hypothetical protein TGAM01_v208309 [Trichoderma gamsii]PON22829.1 hypothetical protein TGAM01_v208309 [Trichoderma gamsii]